MNERGYQVTLVYGDGSRQRTCSTVLARYRALCGEPTARVEHHRDQPCDTCATCPDPRP